jgi:hypothetical protein
MRIFKDIEEMRVFLITVVGGSVIGLAIGCIILALVVHFLIK